MIAIYTHTRRSGRIAEDGTHLPAINCFFLHTFGPVLDADQTSLGIWWVEIRGGEEPSRWVETPPGAELLAPDPLKFFDLVLTCCGRPLNAHQVLHLANFELNGFRRVDPSAPEPEPTPARDPAPTSGRVVTVALLRGLVSSLRSDPELSS